MQASSIFIKFVSFFFNFSLLMKTEILFPSLNFLLIRQLPFGSLSSRFQQKRIICRKSSDSQQARRAACWSRICRAGENLNSKANPI